MDVFTFIFVGLLCLVAFFVTMNVRRDFLTKERQRRERERPPRNPRRKP